MTKLLAAVPFGIALFAGSAFAAPATLTTTVMKESVSRDAEGHVRTAVSPVVKAAPGDQLVYVLTYKNGATKPATGVVITNPIPANMEFAGAGDGPAPLVSTDNQTFAPMDQLKAGLSTVTAVRWTLAEVAPAGQAHMSFRAKLK